MFVSARVRVSLACILGLAAAPPAAQIAKNTTAPTFGLSSDIKPGDDFDAYVNGRWKRETALPADRGGYGTLSVLADQASDEVSRVIERERMTPGSRVGAMYASFMDEQRIEALGLQPLQPWLAKIAKAANKDDLAALAGRLQRIGADGPSELEIAADPREPDRYVARLHQAGIGLSDRSYYLDAGEGADKVQEAYHRYLTDMFGFLSEQDVDARASAVMSFETQVARTQWTPGEQRDEEKSLNGFSWSALATRAPGFDWARYLTALGLSRETDLVVNEPSAAAGMAKAWATAPLPVLKDWLRLAVIDGYGPYLPKRVVDARFALFGTALSGSTHPELRPRKAVRLVTDELRDDVGRAYVQKALPPSAKSQAERLVRDLVRAYQARIARAAWLSPDTQRRAIAKIGRAEILIGYPEHWRDYAGLRIDPVDLVGNVARANSWEFDYKLRRLGQSVDRRDWELTPMDGGGWAKRTLVLIGIPAALLQRPIFDPSGDTAANYGGLGQIVGHELSHLLDDQGRRFDEFGKLAQWWKPDEIAEFSQRSKVLVDQYSSYEPLPGLHIAGGRTLGENLADLSGLQIAYDAYHLSRTDQHKVIDGLDGDQRFFLSFARVLRAKQSPESFRRQILSDVHPPPTFRVNEVRNVSAWYAAFHVEPGQKLFLLPGNRAGVW